MNIEMTMGNFTGFIHARQNCAYDPNCLIVNCCVYMHLKILPPLLIIAFQMEKMKIRYDEY